eukprot:6835890-Alexandrium_andersonii.AAC.1
MSRFWLLWTTTMHGVFCEVADSQDGHETAQGTFETRKVALAAEWGSPVVKASDQCIVASSKAAGELRQANRLVFVAEAI